MKMTMEKLIAAPIDTVFAHAADIANLDKFISGVVKVEMLTEGPVGVGTRFAETRVMFGKEHAETMEVAAFEPNRRIDLVAHNCGCRYDSGLEFESAGDRTRVTFRFNATPQTFMARLMTPLGILMSKTMRKMIDQDLEDLRKACEARPEREA